jgi:hypothetical protein
VNFFPTWSPYVAYWPVRNSEWIRTENLSQTTRPAKSRVSNLRVYAFLFSFANLVVWVYVSTVYGKIGGGGYTQNIKICCRWALMPSETWLLASRLTLKCVVLGHFFYILCLLVLSPPITVAARSRTWTVISRSNTGIVGSNSTRGMVVCIRLFCVCVLKCFGSCLSMGWSPV